MGDRDGYLRAAVAALAPEIVVERLSSVYDTAPLLVTDQPRFHNAACAGWTTLDPSATLRRLKTTEAALGRTPTVRYGPRVIDIDLLFYDQLILASAELTLPHPGIVERAFVLVPLAEIAPDLWHPAAGTTIATLAGRVDATEVRKLGHLLPLPG
jgi:2-amino-4-hydroxy-6-hydroxymethyldihydropteridine diphosphokinase